jgi:hypothetical protein
MIGYAFMSGFKFNNYWQNTTGCFDMITNTTYIQLPAFKSNRTDPSLTMLQKIQVNADFVANLSMPGWYCTSMLRSASYYWNETIAQYRMSKNPGGILLLSAIQNLLSNVIGISNIYTSLSSNLNSNNLTGTWFDVGRLTRILVIFPVI